MSEAMRGDSIDELLAVARARVAAMPLAAQAAMWARQREGYARAEASWPRPRFETKDGKIIFASYEDYCNS